MQPLGYYGLNLGNEVEQAIDGLPLHEQIDLLDDMIREMALTHYINNDEIEEAIIDEHKPIFAYQLSDLEKIGLIRGLCDRIEAKLLEAAK